MIMLFHSQRSSPPAWQDQALGVWSQLGLAGAVMAVFVAPVFMWMLAGVKRREEARERREDEERKERSERERIVTNALLESVQHQRTAIEHWRAFEEEEKIVHATFVNQLAAVTESQREMFQMIRDMKANK